MNIMTDIAWIDQNCVRRNSRAHKLDKEEEDMTSGLEDRKEFFRGQRDYWRQVADSDGFDIDDVSVPRGTTGLLPVDCQHSRFRLRCLLPKFYAMLGLHRYNILKGTNFVYSTLLKYNTTMNCVSSFYITLLAQDFSTNLMKTFQVRVDEKRFGTLDLSVSVARPKDEKEVPTKKPFIPHFHGEAAFDDFYKGELPDWPSVDDFKDQKRFYMVNESELQVNDWIRLYLELALYVDDRWTIRKLPSVLSQLQILKVAIETKEDVQPPSERLKAKCANVYITYKGLAKGPIDEHVERKAIVRRVIDESTGYLTLLGGFLDNEQNSEKRRRLD